MIHFELKQSRESFFLSCIKEIDQSRTATFSIAFCVTNGLHVFAFLTSLTDFPECERAFPIEVNKSK